MAKSQQIYLQTNNYKFENITSDFTYNIIKGFQNSQRSNIQRGSSDLAAFNIFKTFFLEVLFNLSKVYKPKNVLVLVDNIYGPRAGYSKYNHGSLHFEQKYFHEILNESEVSEITIKSKSFWSSIQENEWAKNKYDLIVCSSDFFLNDGNEFLAIEEKDKIFSKKQLEDFETFILAEDCSEETLRFLSIFNLLKKGVNSKFLMIDFNYIFTYGRNHF